MLSTLKVIREKYGGAEGYVINKCGLTNADVEKIRTNLIVEASPITQLAR
jgi:Tyrosine phosphatase family